MPASAAMNARFARRASKKSCSTFVRTAEEALSPDQFGRRQIGRATIILGRTWRAVRSGITRWIRLLMGSLPRPLGPYRLRTDNNTRILRSEKNRTNALHENSPSQFTRFVDPADERRGCLRWDIHLHGYWNRDGTHAILSSEHPVRTNDVEADTRCRLLKKRLIRTSGRRAWKGRYLSVCDVSPSETFNPLDQNFENQANHFQRLSCSRNGSLVPSSLRNRRLVQASNQHE